MKEPPFFVSLSLGRQKQGAEERSAIFQDLKEIYEREEVNKMIDLKRRIVTGIATSAILINALAPVAFAETTIVISGNGAGSDNWTTVNQTNKTTVTQNNNAIVTNMVDADAKTGGNDAGFNTGGNVGIHTGDATVKADITNDLNRNAAEVDCCSAGSTDVKISENGAGSQNGVQLGEKTTTTVTQDNKAMVTNMVDADAKTGGNDAYKNTGGDVMIGTGNATVDTNVSTTANVNSAKVGSVVGPVNPSASFIISGNGAGSDNSIVAGLTKGTKLDQDNFAMVLNTVDADAKTGGNDAGFNTGGDVMIGTGNAKVYADVDNSVNFNYADVDCNGCAMSVLAKIVGNGAEGCQDGKDMDNIINLTLNNSQTLGQGNMSFLTNMLKDLDAKTGHNDVYSSTGEVDDPSDPAINTGDALIDTNVSNSGNVNVIGQLPMVDLSDLLPDFDYDVNFSVNFAALWAFLHMGA